MKANLLDWRYYFILIPVHAITVLLTIAPRPFSLSTFPKWLLVTVVSYAIMAIPFAFARHFRDTLNTINKQLISLTAVGLIRGFVILDLSIILRLPTVKPYILRPLNSALVIPLWFLITHFIIGSRRKFQEDFHEMYTRAVSQQITTLQSTGKKDDSVTAETLSKRIDVALEPLRKQFENLSGRKMSAKELAEEALIVRSFVDAQIRPLSHEFWRTKSFKPPRLAFSRVVIYALFKVRLPLSSVLLPALFVGIIGLTSKYGFSQAILIGVPTWLLYAAITGIYRGIYERCLNWISTLNSIVMFSLLLVPAILSSQIQFSSVIDKPDFTLDLIGALIYFFLLLGFSVYTAVENYYDSIHSIMEAQIALSGSRNKSNSDDALQRDYASYLHGTVQSQLISASMQMERAAEQGNVELGEKARKQAEKILRRNHQKYVVGEAIDPLRKLQKLIDAWSGIADITFSVADSVDISESGYLASYRVLEELISNSIRHGGATQIRIEIERTGNDVLLRFHDNGQAKKGGKRGLGSEILEKESLSFDYERSDSQNISIVVLPR